MTGSTTRASSTLPFRFAGRHWALRDSHMYALQDVTRNVRMGYPSPIDDTYFGFPVSSSEAERLEK
ncbi:MAG: hypothetical protein VW875_05885 [Planctomycetaceae bacterium]